MKKLYDLREKLCKQLEEYPDKDLTSATLDVVDKLTHTIKNLDKIIAKYEGKDEEYSNMYGGSYRMPYMPSYDNYGNGSFARGRGGRRDSMGRYSGGYNNGYSRNSDMIAELTDLMEDAPDERTRMEFQKFIQKMQTM